MFHQSYYPPTVAPASHSSHRHQASASVSMPPSMPPYYNYYQPSYDPYQYDEYYRPAPPHPAPAVLPSVLPAVQPPAAPPAPPSGGINQVLDYDIPQMAAFLSWCGFGMVKQNRPALSGFKNLLVSVLYATRLSRSTIIIALEYMNQRYSSQELPEWLELMIFTKITTALVLANKFNDDNTFTNRSWCGATGLDIAVLNAEEAEWLAAVRWQLSVVPFEQNILTLEEYWATWLDKYTESVTPTPLSPVTPYDHRAYVPYSPSVPYDHWSCRGNMWTYPMYGYNNSYVGYANPYYSTAC